LCGAGATTVSCNALAINVDIPRNRFADRDPAVTVPGRNHLGNPGLNEWRLKMYLPRNASKARLREAQNARNNRAEIVRALSQGQVTRRELVKWGIFTAGGMLALKNGLSPFAPSAYASHRDCDRGGDIPTGTPPSPLFGAQPFSQAMPRLNLQTPLPLTSVVNNGETEVVFPAGLGELNGRRQSYHTDFTASGGTQFINPLTGIGPQEGRPPGEFFAHQRWQQFLPKAGLIMTLGQLAPNISFHPNFPDQGPNAVWTFNSGRNARSVLPPPLIKVRYGEPTLFRHYNALPVDRAINGGFGLNEQTTHNHNAHNASTSDGASNAHFFPGQFYDYHWSTTLARHDTINTLATDPRASGPDGNGGLVNVPGDWRELQSTLWFHDHRFFFTAENVYKGHLGMLNYYSGRDRGHEALDDGVNLRLPSGSLLDWGNTDFDVNLLIADMALDPDGQYFFDIFDTDGFLGDLIHVNFAYRPFMEVLPRKYRFRILCACMSRFIKLALANEQGNAVPFQVIQNDGNFLVSPVTVNELDQQGVAERFDIVVDFSQFQVGEKITLVNLLQFRDGRGPDEELSLSQALGGYSDDPVVGGVMEFRIVDTVESVDVPGVFHHASDPDPSQVPNPLTEQIPLVEPVRERVVEFTRGGGRRWGDEEEVCIPDCGDRESFPWTISVNGEEAHSLNANRVSILVPRPGEVEHWTLVNSGRSWDHPIHLHFEEGITMDRGRDPIPATELLARKDVWRLRSDGQVKFQVQFGEYGGAYVNHCHNTVHEDSAMLLRYDILTDPDNPNVSQTHTSIIPTPNPSPEGVEYLTPEILPEGNPFDPNFDPFPDSDGGHHR
jgi:FtsP/CotA-like multicopper oxidase with cupredoxin domain